MKKISMSKWFSLLLIAVFVISCESDKKENEPKSDNEKQTQQAEETTPLEVVSETKDFKNDDVVYTWVDNLNIRDAANTKGKVVTKVSDKQPLVFTGERSDKAETIVLRGVAYYEPWLKIKVDENNEGWVFGGAVKREGEEKGNAEMTAKKFNFENFGQFDLSSWKLVSTKDTGGEEVDATTKTYTKGGETLTIEESSMGEFYYGYNYVWSKNRKTVKERNFSFGVGGDIDDFVVIETVKDYTTSKQYERQQAINKHFYSLNAKPTMARGKWRTTKLRESAKKNILELLDYSKMPKVSGLDDGCSCSFRTDSDDYQTVILTGTYEDAPKAVAVIQIKGKVIVLKSKKVTSPDSKEGNHHWHYYNDVYDLRISADKTGTDDGGGSQYAGTMKLMQSGKEVTQINIFGGCGC